MDNGKKLVQIKTISLYAGLSAYSRCTTWVKSIRGHETISARVHDCGNYHFQTMNINLLLYQTHALASNLILQLACKSVSETGHWCWALEDWVHSADPSHFEENRVNFTVKPAVRMFGSCGNTLQTEHRRWNRSVHRFTLKFLTVMSTLSW